MSRLLLENSQVAPSAYQDLLTFLQEQRTGCFLITPVLPRSESWLLFCTEGKINFVTSSRRSKSRLQYLIKHYNPSLSLPVWEDFGSDYDYICSLLQSQNLSHKIVRYILSIVSLEAIVQLLAAPSLNIESRQSEPSLDPLLIALDVPASLSNLQGHIQEWKTLHPTIPSLLYCPQAAQEAALNQLISQYSGQPWLANFKNSLAPEHDFYAIATLMQHNVLDLARKVKVLIRQGLVNLASPETAAQPTAPSKSTQNIAVSMSAAVSLSPAQSFKIACVDDSPTILKEIENCLRGSTDEFSIFPIVNSVKALMWLRRIQPDLILMDVGMPGVNGYELCQLIRGNHQFATIPIIMVTGNTSELDRQQAIRVGASDYLTKPFTKAGLLDVVKRHLHLSTVSS